MQIRVGQGYDIHPLSGDPARVLVLGGVAFDGAPGLVGHSDADPIAHACADAILGGAGLGDVGSNFPDTDPSLEGVDSIELLATAAQRVAEAGWQVVNIDCTVVLEAPKVAPQRQEMQRRLSDAVGAPVTVKATRGEGLGPIGRNEGIECHAVALIQRREEH
ncbi:MAG: 2-C-methyl-D-erythritol 2,4-cyclodiphosphate synthase [Acidimicrobiales bacterium]